MADHYDDNESEARALPRPDPHGQAAYLLTESLIHTLIDQSILTQEAAVETVEVAMEVRAEIEYDMGDTADNRNCSVALLDRLAHTLRAL